MSAKTPTEVECYLTPDGALIGGEIKPVPAYQTSDGMLYLTLKQARHAEAKLSLEEAWTGFDRYEFGDFLNWLDDNRDSVRDYLLTGDQK